MKKVKDFNDFIFDLMLEAEKPKFHGVTELPFVLSLRLKQLLTKINHPIAKRLIETDKQREDKKITFVDLSDEADNKFSIINSNKAYDNFIDAYKEVDLNLDVMDVKRKMDDMINFTASDNSKIINKNRADVKIGSFIGKVYPKEFKQGGDPGNDIESFVQAVIAKRKSSDDIEERFKLVNGQDIVKYYYSGNYDVKNPDDDTPVHGSTLASSCMRYDYCADYVSFYANNKDVSLLVLMSDVDGKEDKIVGRAIVWKLSQPSGRTFMDRIYFRYESDMAMFKQYAEKQGWLHKASQNMRAFTNVVDTRDGSSQHRDLRTLPTFKTNDYYPYMDTLKYFHIDDGYLTNDDDDDKKGEVIFLEDTDGGYEAMGEQGRYIDYYGRNMDEDDLIYCEYGGDYRTVDDAIWLEQYGDYATEEYIENNLVWSDYYEQYLDPDESIFSEYHDDYILNEDAIDIYQNADESLEDVEETGDVRHVDEIGRSVIKYQSKDGDLYYFDKDTYGNYFVKVPQISTNIYEDGWKHKVWDKDKIYRHEGEWHYEFDPKVKDEKIGQKRLWDE
jgi:hypothetical protein